jgi:hypothetical protein
MAVDDQTATHHGNTSGTRRKSVTVTKPTPISKKFKAKKKPTAKGTAAAKKAWETRRANAEDPVQAEAERQEALKVLDELAKNRPPVAEE